MIMYKKRSWGWELCRRVGREWVQYAAAVGMTLLHASGGLTSEGGLDKSQARMLRRRGFFVAY